MDFGFEDDVVIERLREAMHELRSQGLGYPGPPPQDELPQKPFGMIPSELKYPPIEKELGLRTGFSDKVINNTRKFDSEGASGIQSLCLVFEWSPFV